MAQQAITAGKFSKDQLAQKWASLKGRLRRAKEGAEEVARKAGVSFATFGAFAGAYYMRQRRKLAGKRNTFDKKGRIDAFFWPGLGVALFGISPFSGNAGPYVTGAGTGLACAGSTDYIDKLAKERHEAANK